MLYALLLAIALLFAGVGVLVSAYVMTRRARLAVHERVNVVARVKVPTAAETVGATAKVATGKLHQGLRQIFAYPAKHSWGMKAGSVMLVLLALFAMAAAWFLMQRVFGFSLWLTVPACLLAGYMLPHSVLVSQQRKAERTFTDLFPDAVDTVARMLRAGLPPTLAIRTVGDDAVPPVSTVFAIIADQMRIGIPLGEALEASSHRIGLADFRFFSVAIGLQHSTGGNLVNTLDVLSQIMRKRRAVRLKAKSVTSEIRLSAYVLGSLPFLTGAGLLVLQPGYLTPLINDPRGQVILTMAAGGLLFSALSMKLMMKSVASE